MYAVADQDRAPPDIWHALADPTRRALIDRLGGGPLTTSQLCDGMPMTRFGVMKHLGILERSGLVVARRQGRERLNHLNRAPLAELHARWLGPRATMLADIGESLKSISEETVMPEAAAANPSAPNPSAYVEVALDWTISASQQQVWATLVDRPDIWWPREHRAGPEGCIMTLGARVGGTLSESRDDGAGLTWYDVIAVDPMSSIDLVGHLASRYGGPATSMLHLSLSPGEVDGTTRLKLTDSVHGRIGPQLAASLTSGWQAIIGEGLVPLAEAGG